MDFTDLIAAVSAVAVVAALTSLATVKMSPGVAKWGYNKIISWFRG